MTGRPFLARVERFPVVGSTNDIVRGWLAEGTPEVCLAVADEQTAGRGRDGRTWHAPRGAALLLSLGFRPTWLAPDLAWRLAATASLAMAEAAESTADLPARSVRLKWPNDLVVDVGAARSVPWRNLDTRGEVRGFDVRKLGGVLGETDGLGGSDPRVVVGIGVNVDWPARDFPPELAATMTSLSEAAGRPVDRDGLLDGFLGRLEARVAALRTGPFDGAAWADRQVTTGELLELHAPDGRVAIVRGLRVEPGSGALVIEDSGVERAIHVGEVRHVRFPMAGGV